MTNLLQLVCRRTAWERLIRTAGWLGFILSSSPVAAQLSTSHAEAIAYARYETNVVGPIHTNNFLLGGELGEPSVIEADADAYAAGPHFLDNGERADGRATTEISGGSVMLKAYANVFSYETGYTTNFDDDLVTAKATAFAMHTFFVNSSNPTRTPPGSVVAADVLIAAAGKLQFKPSPWPVEDQDLRAKAALSVWFWVANTNPVPNYSGNAEFDPQFGLSAFGQWAGRFSLSTDAGLRTATINLPRVFTNAVIVGQSYAFIYRLDVEASSYMFGSAGTPGFAGARATADFGDTGMGEISSSNPDVRFVLLSAPGILNLQMLPNGSVGLKISAGGAMAADLAVECTSNLANPIPWVTETSAVIRTNAAGYFDAEVPRQGNLRFYRVRRTW